MATNPADQNLQRFNGMITQLEGGRLNEELSEKVQQCIEEISSACMERGGEHKSVLTLKLSFKMNQSDRFVQIEAEINEKFPKAPRGRAGIYFIDEHGNLTREDPKQLSMNDELQRHRQRPTG